MSVAAAAGMQLGVVSQHRFDDSTLFLKRAIEQGRLGRILQADAYIKWYRSAEYYGRPIKGSWSVEGGGALITQAIHQLDLLLHLVGPVTRVFGEWQLGALALHRVGGRCQRCPALCEWSDGCDPGLDCFLARLLRTH